MESVSGSSGSSEKEVSLNDTGAEEDGEEIVTMLDVLEQESEQEADANDVLGWADDSICTYAEGYLKRQPLYACRTCCKNTLAGVCLACSYKCHEGHDLVELYTKRDFRCDCGNSLFTSNCSLDPIKDDVNEKNKYNQNFRGVYCTCHRPYPDPEDPVSDVMTQCVVCEDWYHGRHLERKDVSDDAEGEIICHDCMSKLPFLGHYLKSPVKDNDGGGGACKIAGLAAPTAEPAAATCWPSGWRQQLCRCAACITLYTSNQIMPLLDEGDSVASYEARNKQAARESQYERGMRALNSLDHVKQVEAIQGFNDMKSALMEHLQKFKESNKVVCEKDIREFFEEFQAKRRRVHAPPTTCR